MSSTDRPADDPQVRRFYSELLLPAASALRARLGDLFPTGPDPDAETYYGSRRTTRMARQDFESLRLDSVEALPEILRELWESRDLPELASLSPALADLARSLRPEEEQGDEVSPFIYVMF